MFLLLLTEITTIVDGSEHLLRKTQRYRDTVHPTPSILLLWASSSHFRGSEPWMATCDQNTPKIANTFRFMVNSIQTEQTKQGDDLDLPILRDFNCGSFHGCSMITDLDPLLPLFQIVDKLLEGERAAYWDHASGSVLLSPWNAS